MSRAEKVYYNPFGVGHVISYATDDKKPIQYDSRSRWAYLVVSKREAKQILSEKETSSDEILDKLEDHYYSHIEKAIKEEESSVTYPVSFQNIKYIDNKKVVTISAPLTTIKGGKALLLKAKKYLKSENILNSKEQQTISLLEHNEQTTKEHLHKEYEFIKTTRATLADAKDAQEPYAVISIPYVYNFEDNKDITSKLIVTIKQEDMISSLIDPYQVTGQWTDANKKEILEHDISDKEQDVYFYVKTVDMEDGTNGTLTIMDEDYGFDDKITSLDFTINNNEAFILIEFEKIKFNMVKALKAESIISKKLDEEELVNNIRDNLELYTKVTIKDYNINKELAKEKYLATTTGYINIGTRSLGNAPYPDSFPSGLIPGRAGYAFKGSESALDKLNLEPIHQHIAFKDDENVGFTTAYEENNEDANGDDYGMLKTDPEMSKIPNTKLALKQYAWDKYYCDEDTFKEAIYQIINNHKYAVSQPIARMNDQDVRRQTEEALPGKQAKFFKFTPIIRYTPEEGLRYSLLTENCQAFVEKVLKKYETLVAKAIEEESLSW